MDLHPCAGGVHLTRVIPYHAAALLLLLVACPGCARQPLPRAPPRFVRRGGDPDLRVTGEVRYLYGPVAGRLQTPTGGQPGTTTSGRPTLHELEMDEAAMPDVSVRFNWADHEAYAGYRYLHLSSHTVIDPTLVSQGHTFEAGTPVDSEVTLDWFRAGYRHRFVLGLPDGLPPIELFPGGGVAVWDLTTGSTRPAATTYTAITSGPRHSSASTSTGPWRSGSPCRPPS